MLLLDVASQIQGLIRYSDDFAKTARLGRFCFWYKDMSDKADSSL